MTLLEVIRSIEIAARRQPEVRMVVQNDIFRLNTIADARYGVFAWTQGRHRATVTDDYIRYSFVLYYVDRLRNDQANQIEVQSVGISTLTNILRTLEGWGLTPETYEFQTFNQRFTDECAGVYCSVVLIAPEDYICPENYDEEGDVIAASDASLRTWDDMALAGRDGSAYVLEQTASEVQKALNTVLAAQAATSQPAEGMLPNVLYTLGELSGSVAFHLAPAGEGVLPHWYWTFDTGQVVPTLTWPTEILRWCKGSAPELKGNTHYEISVLNGYAAYMEV